MEEEDDKLMMPSSQISGGEGTGCDKYSSK